MVKNELFKDVFYSRTNNAITMFSKRNYESLYFNVKRYSDILKDYKDAGIDRVGIIVGDEPNFSTMALVLALIKKGITPFIMNKSIGEKIKGILESESIKVVFHETINKPEYLEKFDVLLYKDLTYFATANPYIKVDNRMKMKDIKWSLKFLKPKSETTPCICHVYDTTNNKIVDEVITEESLDTYNKILQDLENGGRGEKMALTLPLYKEEGISLLITAVCNYMSVICLNKNNSEKNLNKILKSRPSVITLELDMLVELIKNVKFRNIDLSFLKIVVLGINPEHYSVADSILKKLGFAGEYVKPEVIQKEKIKNYE